MNLTSRRSSSLRRPPVGRVLVLTGVGWFLASAALVGGCSPDFDKLTANLGCANGVKDGTETDVDCGGDCSSAGMKCSLNKECKVDTDCSIGLCSDGRCSLTVNLCNNGVHDVGEGGVDCGGNCATTALCPMDSPCLSASDCIDGTTCLSATKTCGIDLCANGVQDPGETDADCGGTCAPAHRCYANQFCKLSTDCSPGMLCLSSGKCGTSEVVVLPCENKVKDAGEGDVDCGAQCAPKLCDVGRSCSDKTDCASKACAKGKCVEPSCSDEVQDQTESDVDCGGGCAKCDTEKKCGTNVDCKSGICGDPDGNRICKEQSCSDNLLSPALGETFVDCGGTCATAANGWKRCPVDRGCKVASDCQSFVCPPGTGVCEAATVIPAANLIDDFEDSNSAILTREGRAGGAYLYGDGTATAVAVPPIPASAAGAGLTPEELNGAKGPGNLGAVHVTGSGFTSWGSGFGFELNNPNGSPTVKGKYDCSAHKGVAFWARTGNGTSVQMQLHFPSLQTFYTDGSLCLKGGDGVPAAEMCDDHFVAAAPAVIGADWKYFKMPFAGAAQQGFAKAYPSGLDLKVLVGLQFRFAKNTTYDVWLDDLAFYD